MGAIERTISNTMAFELAESEPAVVSARPAAWDLESLVREHSRLVFRIGYSVVRNPSDAEDVVQEVFLRLAKHGTAGIEDPKAWISRIAWRVAVDRYRQTSRAQQEEFDERLHAPENVAASTEQLAVSRETLALLERMIATLPKKERDALLLTSVEELSSSEAARVLSTTETSVRARVFRARQRLVQKLQKMKGASYGR